MFTNTESVMLGKMLTLTGDIVEWQKEHFEELLNQTNMFSLEEAEFEDSVVASPISLAKVSEVVKKFRSSNPAGVDEIRHEMLKALDIIGLFWLTYLLSVMCRSGIVPVEWQIRVAIPNFEMEEGVLQLSGYIRVLYYSVSSGIFFPECWKRGSNRLLNMRCRRSHVNYILAVKHWNSSLLLHGCFGVMGLCPSSLHVLWTWR